MTDRECRSVLRVLDANFNRSREGLRVCEEVFRFLVNDRILTRRLKEARHEITDVFRRLPADQSKILAARDVRGDSGKGASHLEELRSGFTGLFKANMQRAKESLRALEEFSKLLDPVISRRFKRLRFKVYAIEKRALPKLEVIRHHGQKSAGR